MKCFTNAKERDSEEWTALFAMADPRFKFLGVRTPLGSKASFIEAEWCAQEEMPANNGIHDDGVEDGMIKTVSVDEVKLDVLRGEVVA
jgi:hypothetical protein